MDHQQPHHLYYDGSSCYQPPNFPGYFPLNCYTSLLPVPSPAHISKEQLNGLPTQHAIHHHQYNPPLQLQNTITHKTDAVNLSAQKAYQVEAASDNHSSLPENPLHNIPHQNVYNGSESNQARYYTTANSYQTDQHSIYHQTPVAPPSPAVHPLTSTSSVDQQHEPEKDFLSTPLKSVAQIPSRDDIVSKKLTCSQCSFSTFNKQTLTNHTAKHTGQGLHICPHCPFTSAYLGTYKRHMIRKHSDREPKSPSKKQKDRISCPQCPFVTIYKKNMKKHMSKHTGEGLHKCPHCDYDTAYMAAFRKHMLKHNEEVSFPCTQCDYKAPAQSILDKHVISKHAEKLTYSCIKCNFNTTYKRSYKNHMIRHSPPYGKYECGVQDCTFNTNDLVTFKEHVNEHNKGNSYQCRHCPYSTSFKGLFRFHLSSHTAVETEDKSGCVLESVNMNNRPETIQTVMLQPQQMHTMLHPQVYAQHPQNVSILHSQNPQQQLVLQSQHSLVAPSQHTVMHPVHNMQQTLQHMPHQTVMQQMHPIVNHAGHNIQYTVMHQIPNEIKQHNINILASNDSQQHDVQSVHYQNAPLNQPQQTTQSLSNECNRKETAVPKQKKNDNINACETQEKLYKCKECAYTTSLKNDLRIHKVTHKGKGLHTCPECPFTTAYRGTFKRHMSKHSKGDVYECSLCNYKSSLKHFFDKHMENKHKESNTIDDSERPDSISARESYKNSIQKYKKSKIVHNDVNENSNVVGRLQCEHCSYSTDLSSTFKRHSSKHMKEKCFSCLRCSYTAECLATFNRHIVKHDDAGSGFSCSHCLFKASTQQKLDDHLSRKHKRSVLKKKKRRRVRKAKLELSDDEDFFPPELQLVPRSTASRRKLSSTLDSVQKCNTNKPPSTKSSTANTPTELCEGNADLIYDSTNSENTSLPTSPSKSCLLQFSYSDKSSTGPENCIPSQFSPNKTEVGVSSSSHSSDIPSNLSLLADSAITDKRNTTLLQSLGNCEPGISDTHFPSSSDTQENYIKSSTPSSTPPQTAPSIVKAVSDQEQAIPDQAHAVPDQAMAGPTQIQFLPVSESLVLIKSPTSPSANPSNSSPSTNPPFPTHSHLMAASPHTVPNSNIILRQGIYFYQHC